MFPLDGVDAGVVLVAPVPTLRWSLVVLNTFWLDLLNASVPDDLGLLEKYEVELCKG